MAIELLDHKPATTLTTTVQMPHTHDYAGVMEPFYNPHSKKLFRTRDEMTNYLWNCIYRLRPQTAHHSARVANFLSIMTVQFEKTEFEEDAENHLYKRTFDPAPIEGISRTIGLLHDIGKIDAAFWSIYGPRREDVKNTGRWHAVTGENLLRQLGYHTHILKAVLYHHENYDGTGKQYGVSRYGIPELAAQLRYADFFDACMCRMPLKPTLETIRSKIGAVFHPYMRRNFEWFAQEMLTLEQVSPQVFQVYEPFQAGKKPAGE